MVAVAIHEEFAANMEALFIDAENDLYTFVLKLPDGLAEPYLGCTLGHDAVRCQRGKQQDESESL
jgi:hypothetical protein